MGLTRLRWALAGGKPQAIACLKALTAAGFPPDFVMLPRGLPENDQAEMASAADDLGVALHDNDKARLAGMARELDLLLVCRFELLPAQVFEAPRIGALNIHSSLLPAYRGFHPVSWALIDGAEKTGVTIHRIDAGIDTGPIVAQAALPISDHHDLWSLTEDLDRLAADLAVSTFRFAAANDILPMPIVSSYAPSYGRRRTPADGRIDWAKPAQAVFNLLRALPKPLPPAYTIAPGGGETLVRRAEIIQGGHSDAPPGRVLVVENTGWCEVQCGLGSRLRVLLEPLPVIGTQFS
jgi:UDP-4-amino-4-deoxy-L-arabinose formyltransferase/UDP-glucuronic acid dehydrogenase (UDP-4-keto-hexauronic acid decarboxylating)